MTPPAGSGAGWIQPNIPSSASKDNLNFDYLTTVYLDPVLFSSGFTSLSGACSADDYCAQIFVNGEEVITPYPIASANPTAMWRTSSTFTIPRSCLGPGINTIIFRVYNSSGPTGLLVYGWSVNQ